MASNVKSGEKIFMSKCAHCHDIGAGHKQGPNLNGLFGRRAGASPGYSYSAANKNMTVVWEESSLQDYRFDPEKVWSSKSTKMDLLNLKEPQERIDLTDYLKEQNRTCLPVSSPVAISKRSPYLMQRYGSWKETIPSSHSKFTREKMEKEPPIYPPNHPIHLLVGSIRSISMQGQLSEAFKYFSLLQLHSSSSILFLHPISSLLAASTNLKALLQGKQLHAHIISLGLHSNPFLISRLCSFYSTTGLLSDAKTIVEDSNTKHALPWNLLISAYVRNGFWLDAIFAYKKMVGRGCEVDKFTYPSVLKACNMILDLDLGRVIHGIIEISGLQHDLFIRNALVSMYANCGMMSVARKLFDVMSEKDNVTWNSLIAGYSSKGMVEESFELLEKMQLEESKMNTVTLNTIAAANSHMGKHLEALKLIAKMRNNDSSIDSASLVIGLNSCSRIGHLRLGLAVGTQEEETFEVFHDMIRSQVQPNYVTLMTVVSICARTNNLRYGQELHCYITKHGFNNYQLLCNSLIDMYSKSGRISVARRVFNMMTDYDRVSYTCMIAGYGMQGEGMKALDLFDKMICRGIKPDGITMVVVLSACGHSGLITQGEMLFEKMFVIYGIFPQMEHYSCMVDLFVRAGFLRNAEEFIDHMPFEPSTAMLATLIRACQAHGNREIGERAAKRLLEMRSDDPNHYLLIANMFTYCENWEELAGVRTVMNDKGIIELYLLLAGLFEHMRDVGYVGNQDFGV